MLFYTVLFSLGKPEDNYYFYMMMLMYKSLVRTESIGPDDRFFVIADEATAAYGRTFRSLSSVLWVPVPAVRTLKDGMLLKYIFRPKVDETVLYLDCDFVAKGKVRFDLPPDTIAVLPEGKPTDSNYCGDFTLTSVYGASAGIFAFRYGPRIKAILDEIGLRVMKCEKGYYTLDQPHFNAVLQNQKVATIRPEIVSFNGHGDVRSALLINCAGIPGAGSFHFGKMMEFFLLL